jgi:hypothetical protein
VRSKPHSPRLRRDHPLARGLVACWPFPGGRATAPDLVAGRALTKQAGTDAASGDAAWFDGSTFYSASLTPPTGHLSLLVRYRTAFGEITFVTWNEAANGSSGVRDRSLYLEITGPLHFNVFDGSARNVVGTGSTADSAWHTAAGVVDGSLRLYQDGRSVGTPISGVANGYNSYATPHLIVGHGGPGPYIFLGAIDLVYVLDRGVTAAEVAEWHSDPYALVRPRRPILVVPSGGGDQSITATGIASTVAFGSATITPGAVSITATGLASTVAFGSATITPGAVAITAQGLPSAVAFGSATVSPGAVAIAATGLASTVAFGSATITAGAVAITATGLASTVAFGSATIVGEGSVVALGLASTVAFGSATITPGPVAITATGLASTVAFGSATVFSGQAILATGLPSAVAFGSPTLTPGAVAITATGLASTVAFGSATIVQPGATQAITATGLASTVAFGLARIREVLPGVRGTASIRLSPPPVAEIGLDPPPSASIRLG